MRLLDYQPARGRAHPHRVHAGSQAREREVGRAGRQRPDAHRTAGGVERAPLANNVLPDRDAARRRAEIATLKTSVGACAMNEPIAPISAMEGTFRWTCATGTVAGRVQRAPTPMLSVQVVDFRAGN